MKEILVGRLAAIFWVGLVVLGIVVPLTILAIGALDIELPASWLITGIICEIIGGLSLRYCLLKGGVYAPLIPTNRPE